VIRLKDRVAKSVFWIFWSRGGIQLMSLLSTTILARVLDPSDYGVMALAGIWTGTIAMLAELGITGAVVQFPDLKKSELNACFWVALSVALTGYGLLFLAAPFIAGWFHTPILASVLRVAGLSLPLVALRTIPDGLLRKRLEFDKISKAEIAASVVTVPSVLLMAWLGAGVWTLVFGALLQVGVATLVINGFVGWRPGFALESERLGQLLRFSATSLAARVSWSLYDQIDAFILGKHSGGQVLGFYSIARYLSTLPVERVSVVVNSVAFPIMAEIQQDVEAMQRQFLRGLRLLACLSVPLCLGLAFVADDAVRVFLGDKWIPSIPLVKVLCAYSVIHSLAVLFPPVLFARYRVGYLVRWTLALIAVMPFAFWAGAVRLGPLGVALAWVFCYPVFVVVLVRTTLRELELKWAAVWHQLQSVISAAAVMSISVLIVEASMTADSFATRLFRLVVATSVGAIVYTSWLLWRRAPVAREMAEVLRWLVGGRVQALPEAR
jgi:teichuronic acid exporter